MQLPSHAKPSGSLTARNYAGREAFSPSAVTTFSAAGPLHLGMQSGPTSEQEARREALLRYKEAKKGGGGAAAPTGASGAATARVPPLAMSAMRDAQAHADGSRTARATAGTYGGSGGGAAAAGAPLSARVSGPYVGARAAGNGRTGATAAAPGAAGAGQAAAGAVQRSGQNGGGAGYGASHAARAAPAPRVMAPPRGTEQRVMAAAQVQLPTDAVWDAAQVALPVLGPDEAAALSTPLSRRLKSPLRGAMPTGPLPANLWSAKAQQAQAQGPAQPAPSSMRSPPPPNSARGAPMAQGGGAAGAVGNDPYGIYGARAASSMEASTSDTGGRSVRDQIKLIKNEELLFQLLRKQHQAASKARIDKGQRQLCACALLLADLLAQSAALGAARKAAEVRQRTALTVATLVPLLERWSQVQDALCPATREVVVALQNAMTSLPLVNGAALAGGQALAGGAGPGPGSDPVVALGGLRQGLAKALGAMQLAEAALAVLLGSAAVAVGGAAAGQARSQAQAARGPVVGGVPAMAEALPELQATLVGEVAALRSLLADLNALAAKMDEAASLRELGAAAGADTDVGAGAGGEAGPGGGLDVEGMLDGALGLLGLDVQVR
ncbi:hypothetical protein HYH03_017473 [Edaphochlamys debaryana]|uniref:Uncharacterized protein n=1 Tax=Edaphochlamys debaryana TaxID=47281 RepID=A0A836BP38_9CHLO|nr:hypothetical protein HYH03_017473 [Edaphochlamys debaryana]|eukprot:KAG2483670.1 hypothetical protein HYH03_017473 [Edaphochlamys debaryana]